MSRRQTGKNPRDLTAVKYGAGRKGHVVRASDGTVWDDGVQRSAKLMSWPSWYSWSALWLSSWSSRMLKSSTMRKGSWKIALDQGQRLTHRRTFAWWRLNVDGRWRLWWLRTYPLLSVAAIWRWTVFTPVLPCCLTPQMFGYHWKFGDICHANRHLHPVWQPSLWIFVYVAWNYMTPEVPNEMCLGSTTDMSNPHYKTPICRSIQGRSSFCSHHHCLRYKNRPAVAGLSEITIQGNDIRGFDILRNDNVPFDVWRQCKSVIWRSAQCRSIKWLSANWQLWQTVSLLVDAHQLKKNFIFFSLF